MAFKRIVKTLLNAISFSQIVWKFFATCLQSNSNTGTKSRYFYLTPCVNGNFHCFLRQAYDILFVRNYHEYDLEKETP